MLPKEDLIPSVLASNLKQGAMGLGPGTIKLIAQVRGAVLGWTRNLLLVRLGWEQSGRGLCAVGPCVHASRECGGSHLESLCVKPMSPTEA